MNINQRQKQRKYHLRKVQPVNKNKNINYSEWLSTVKQSSKQFPINNGRPKKRRQKVQKINQKNTENAQLYGRTYKTITSMESDRNKLNRISMINHLRSVDKFPKLSIINRKKSLNYWKKPQQDNFKFLQSVQKFIKKIVVSDQDGCQCTSPCKWRTKFKLWINQPDKIINQNFQIIVKRVKQISSNPTLQKSFYEEYQSTGESLQSLKQTKKVFAQIEKDIKRTQPLNATFCNLIYHKRIKLILQCYAIDDPELGYVQGMNMILSGLIYHIKDQITTYTVFWKIIQKIRGIYLNNFQQCYQHLYTIERNLQNNVNDLYEHLKQLNIEFKVLCLSWILSLMCAVVPLLHLHLVYDGFIDEGWIFLHKLIISIFLYHKQQLISTSDDSEVMMMLSITNQNNQQIQWVDIISYAKVLKL